ncbi:MAG TPA: ABC transporter permease [Candidatus Acidoferrales bacterium]|nr:ABC transporter permease [Candidatus Acidoferrales bacterium]HEV2342287.1 ABC transporter permease [Candidatus Acidoferrales bacterium]
MTTLWQDLRYGLRLLLKTPGFTIIAILTLALGIGATSTVFSWINATLLTPVPGMPHPSQVVSIVSGARGDAESISYLDFKDLRDRNHSFSGMTAFGLWPVSLTGTGKPIRVWGTVVSANYFDVLGVRPQLGRGFLPSEDAAQNGAPVAVISYRLWQGHFGGNPSIVGTIVHINTHPFTIVGVTPPVFQGSYSGLRTELWMPVVMVPELDPTAEGMLKDRGSSFLDVDGRLLPGVDRLRAQGEMNSLAQEIAGQFPDSHKGKFQLTLYPLWRAPHGGNAFFSLLLPMLMALAGAVLLLACANIANLLLARSVSRQKEIAVRLSLGASRFRLVRQLLVENLIMALCGGVFALVVTLWTARRFMDLAPTSNLPVYVFVPVDRIVILATFLISILTCCLFGILPALRASALSPVGILKDESGGIAGGRRKAWLSNSLTVAQISLSLLLLVSAGLFIRSFRAQQNYDIGFNPKNVLLETYDLYPSGYSQAAGIAFDQQVLDRVRLLPGVQSASIANWTPLGFSSNSDSFLPEGYVPGPHEVVGAGINIVSPGYFATTEIPLLHGRDFALSDSAASQKVVIINDTLANRYWRNQDAVGKRLKIQGDWAAVVGIARTSEYYDLKEKPRPFIYLPLYQFYSSNVILHVRTANAPLASASAVTDAIHQLNTDLPVFDVSTLEARTKTASFVQHMAGTFVGAFGILALALAAVGIYGLIAYSTRQRTHEIGIRMALGAQPGDVMRLILGQGMWLTGIGIGIGVLASLGLARLMSSLLFGVSASDPLTYISVVILLALVALLATYLPARRAMRTDPMLALRHE